MASLWLARKGALSCSPVLKGAIFSTARSSFYEAHHLPASLSSRGHDSLLSQAQIWQGSNSFFSTVSTEADSTVTAPAMHPGLQRSRYGTDYLLMQPIYKPEDLDIKPHSRPITGIRDSIASTLVKLMRTSFDLVTGYKHDQPMTESHWLRRVLFLETVAGVPGMVAGMLRHMTSLRTMKRDHGWIHTLLEEAENERMHLLTFLQVRQGGPLLRLLVLAGQGVFFNAFFAAYILSPRTCHRFVGYLEEEAVRTYTHLLTDIDHHNMKHWATTPAPLIAVNYWQLCPKSATLRDVVLAVRADEACHSHVNHTFAEMEKDDTNPFGRGDHDIPKDFTQPRKVADVLPTDSKT